MALCKRLTGREIRRGSQEIRRTGGQEACLSLVFSFPLCRPFRVGCGWWSTVSSCDCSRLPIFGSRNALHTRRARDEETRSLRDACGNRRSGGRSHILSGFSWSGFVSFLIQLGLNWALFSLGLSSSSERFQSFPRGLSLRRPSALPTAARWQKTISVLPSTKFCGLLISCPPSMRLSVVKPPRVHPSFERAPAGAASSPAGSPRRRRRITSPSCDRTSRSRSHWPVRGSQA